jgi:hypothetical protein
MFLFSLQGVTFAFNYTKHYNMKKIGQYVMVVMLMTTIYSAATAQVRKLPAVVTEAFKQKYPTATNVEWHDKLTLFMASFDMGNEKYDARFSNKGVWQNTESELEEAELPAAIKEGYDKSKYAEWKINSITRIELPGDKVQYRVKAEKSDLNKKYLLFSNTGRLLKDNITL